MIITPHKYPFAINDDGQPIYIDDINQDNRKQSHYHCYGCGAELFPVLGEVREHHFRHQKDAICDPDKYLHEFAKATIKKRFDESEKFIVQYQAKQICKNKSKCKFAEEFNWEECEHDGLYALDLKEFYDTCTSEKGYYQEIESGKKRYIADLILTNSKDPKIESICIEVWVTHECTEDKKLNGGRIIEIKITSEKDAKRALIESEDENLPIRFFNFKRVINIEPSRKFLHVKLLPSITNYVIVVDKTICAEGLTYDPKGQNEIIFSQIDINPNVLENIYEAKCNLNGWNTPNMYFCSLGKVFPKDDKYITLQCQYYRRERKCPCQFYKYSQNKAKEFIDNNHIPFWEQTNQE